MHPTTAQLNAHDRALRLVYATLTDDTEDLDAVYRELGEDLTPEALPYLVETLARGSAELLALIHEGDPARAASTLAARRGDLALMDPAA